mgnify:CR=1 FL=1
MTGNARLEDMASILSITSSSFHDVATTKKINPTNIIAICVLRIINVFIVSLIVIDDKITK